jgi:predicted Zn-dependent protease
MSVIELESLLGQALTYADDGDWQSAMEFLRRHLEDFEQEPAVHCALGVAERELGHEGIAYELFKKTLSLEPDDPYVMATAGNGIAAFDDPDAMDALKNAALLAPDVPVTRLLYGAYLAREGFHEWAIEQLAAAWVLDAEDPQIAYELGVAHALSGAVEAAVDALSDSVRLDPEDGWTRLVFGLLLLEDGQPAEASGELTEGARLLPEDVEAQLLAALAAAATGEEGTAYEMVERARMRAAEGDLALVASVEEHVDSGTEASEALLKEDLAPDSLRARLQERP